MKNSIIMAIAILMMMSICIYIYIEFGQKMRNDNGMKTSEVGVEMIKEFPAFGRGAQNFEGIGNCGRLSWVGSSVVEIVANQAKVGADVGIYPMLDPGLPLEYGIFKPQKTLHVMVHSL